MTIDQAICGSESAIAKDSIKIKPEGNKRRYFSTEVCKEYQQSLFRSFVMRDAKEKWKICGRGGNYTVKYF